MIKFGTAETKNERNTDLKRGRQKSWPLKRRPDLEDRGTPNANNVDSESIGCVWDGAQEPVMRRWAMDTAVPKNGRVVCGCCCPSVWRRGGREGCGVLWLCVHPFSPLELLM